MRHIGIVMVVLAFFGGGLASAEEPSVAPAAPTPPPLESGEAGRFVFHAARVQGGLEYLLDSTTGDLWVISRDPDTKYVYLGFIPKGPTFTFQDILRQKQIKRVPAEP